MNSSILTQADSDVNRIMLAGSFGVSYGTISRKLVPGSGRIDHILSGLVSGRAVAAVHKSFAKEFTITN